MANNPSFASTPLVGKASIASGTAANTSFSVASGIPTSGVLLVTGAATGTRVQNIQAQGATTVASTIILWLYDGTNSYPIDFYAVSAITPTTNGVTTPWQLTKAYPMLLVPSGSFLYVTTTVTTQVVSLVAFGASY